MCYSIIVGKKAAKEGKVILAANDDWPGCPGHILYESARDYGKEAEFTLVSGHKIPQKRHTYAYMHSAAAYETGWRTESWNEGVNECGVSVSMDGIYAFREIPSNGQMQADDVPILILERAQSARDAVEMIGELIEKYGFAVSDIEGAAGAVVLAIADEEEGFFMEILPGGVWVAKRVEDNEVEVRPNCLGIQEVQFDEPTRFLYSANVKTKALECGFWSGKGAFNFSSIYSSTQAICAYGGPYDEVNMYRRWNGIYRLAGLDMELDAQVYAAKASKVSVKAVQDLLGDGMQDTKYDLSKQPGAGQHHNPYFMDINTSVGQAGTVVGMVVDYFRGNDITGPLAWFAFGNAGIAPFVPCFLESRGLPGAYTRGVWGEYSESSAWYIMEELCEQVYKRYDEVMPYVTRSKEVWSEKFDADYNAETWKEDVKKFTDEYALWILGNVKEQITYLKGHCIANTFLQ